MTGATQQAPRALSPSQRLQAIQTLQAQLDLTRDLGVITRTQHLAMCMLLRGDGHAPAPAVRVLWGDAP